MVGGNLGPKLLDDGLEVVGPCGELGGPERLKREGDAGRLESTTSTRMVSKTAWAAMFADW